MNRNDKPTTPPPPRGDTPPQVMRNVAAEMRKDASRWLQRANEIEEAADRWECKQS
jgi:hypothetical protein